MRNKTKKHNKQIKYHFFALGVLKNLNFTLIKYQKRIDRISKNDIEQTAQKTHVNRQNNK